MIFFLKNRSGFRYDGSSNINDVIRAVLNFFFTKRYCTHKNTHKQISASKTKKLTLNNKGNNFSRVKTSNLFYPCLQQPIDSNPFILFIYILTNF